MKNPIPKLTKISLQEIMADWRKITFLIMLVVFLPSALYLLIIGQHGYFFLVAAVFYLLIKLIKAL